MLDVYVQGFNADMVVTAALTDGDGNLTTDPVSSLPVSPDFSPGGDPDNLYAVGFFRVTYAGAGETLTLSVTTADPRHRAADESAFANAGFFAATVAPEPSTAGLCLLGLLAARARRDRRA